MRIAAFPIVAAVLLLAGSAALAQDGDGAPPPGEPGLRIEAVALDYSTMLKSQHGGAGALKPLPLAGVEISVAVKAPGKQARLPDTSAAARTDEQGRFTLEIAQVPPGAMLHFIVPARTEDGGSFLGYYARPYDVESGVPLEEVRFFEVADSPRGIFQRVMQVVTVLEEGAAAEKVIQLRHIALVQNQSFRVWWGDPRSDMEGSFHIPVPDGYELRDVRLDGRSLATDAVVSGHGGTVFVHRDPIFPTVPGQSDGYRFSAILIGPYVDGSTVDMSWHTELPIVDYRLGLESPTLVYAPPEPSSERLALEDGGENPPMGNSPKTTHAWVGSGIQAHTNIGAIFTVGRPFPWRPTLMVLAILLVAAAAVLLGRSFGRRTPTPGTGTATDGPPTGTALADLDERRRIGEITSVEYEIRKRALTGMPPPGPSSGPPRAPDAPAAPAHDPAREGLLRSIDEIVRRAPDAPDAQLRDDVRALARALRDLLEG